MSHRRYVNVSVAVFTDGPWVAEIVEVVFDVTAVVFTVNVIDVLPAGTVTEPGTVAEDELLDRGIESPPAGATELIVRVPVIVFPPLTEAGFSAKETMVGLLTVRVTVFTKPFRLAVIVATD